MSGAGAVVARARRLLPGLAVLVVVAVVTRAVGTRIPGLSPLILAIAVGAVVANTVGVPARAKPGIDYHKLFLEAGIVLLGAQLTIEELVETGPVVVALAAGVVVFGVLYVETVLGQAFDVGARTQSLLAAGASVCGVSAVLAVAGSIEVDETDVTYAVGTILLFDAVTLVVFPLVGAALGITGKQFGIWAGLSLFSTGPTAAVGFAMSETAGQWATVTKLVRNTFIGVLAIAYAVRYTTGDASGADLTKLWGRFPKFLFGFVFVAVVANVFALSDAASASIATTGDWLFTLAFAGLGFHIDVGEVRTTGVQPIFLVSAHFVTVSVVALAAVLLVF